MIDKIMVYNYKSLLEKDRIDTILVLLISVNLVLYSLVNTKFSYYYFSENYIPIFLKSYRIPLLIINIVMFIIIIGLYVIRRTCLEFIIKKSQENIIRTLSIVTIISGLLCNSAFGYYSFISTNFVISGNSMYPTYKDQSSATLRFTNIFKRYDVIVFKVDSYNLDADFSSSSSYFIKRIIGLPGDRIILVQNKLYINDELVEEPYIPKSSGSSSSSSNSSAADGTSGDVDYPFANFDGLFKYKLNGSLCFSYTIPQGFYFVLGDNRSAVSFGSSIIPASFDSRSFGLVPFNSILGSVD